MPLASNIDNSLGRKFEIFLYPVSVYVLELVFVLLIEGNLTLKKNVTENDNLINFWYLESLLKNLAPNLEHLTDLANFFTAIHSIQLILLLAELKLELEAQVYHADGEDTWLVL